MADASRYSAGRPPGNQNTYVPIADPGGSTIPPGTPVTQSSADAGTAVPAASSTLRLCSASGLAAAAGLPGRGVPVQFLGPLTLATEQWDQVTAQSGGLTRGEAYYVGSTPGTLFPGRPGGNAGLVGVALSSTTMFVRPGFAVAP
jgi:hypothetical protein